MKTFLETANLDEDRAKSVMAKSQMDLFVGAHDGRMVLAFEKNAKSTVDKQASEPHVVSARTSYRSAEVPSPKNRPFGPRSGAGP